MSIVILIVLVVLAVSIALYFITNKHMPIRRGGSQQRREKFYKRSEKFENISIKQNYQRLLEGYHDVYRSTDTTVDLFSLYYPHLEKYQDTTGMMAFTMHIGQLKLILNEIQFLTYCLEKHDEPAYVVYAGSSPSNKGFYFTKLFPKSTFILIDPHEHYIIDRPGHDQYSSDLIETILYFRVAENNRFNIKNRRINLYGRGVVDRDSLTEYDMRPTGLAAAVEAASQQIIIIEDLMDEKMAAELSKLPGKILFISDIRTAVSGYNPHDVDILFNSAQQLWWITLLRPAQYMLKFRPPFNFTKKGSEQVRREVAPYMKSAFDACRELGVDFIKDHAAGRFVFLKYKYIWLQPFGREFTAETRLVGNSIEFDVYPHVKHEDYMYYFNCVKRPFGFHYEHEKYIDKEIGIDRCGDCALMCKILSEYYGKFGLADQTKETITALLKTISRRLKTPYHYHGRFYYRLDKELRYVIDVEYALVFIREYGHLANLRTKKKSLDHFYKRYLAKRHAAGNRKLMSRQNVCDFISRKSKFYELYMRYNIETEDDKKIVDGMMEIMAGDATCPTLRLEGNKLHIGNFVEEVSAIMPTIEETFVRFVRTDMAVKYETAAYARFVNMIIKDRGASTVHFVCSTACESFKPADTIGVCCTAYDGYCDIFNLITDILFLNIDGQFQIMKYLIGKKLLAMDRPTVIFSHTHGIPFADTYWVVDGLVPIRCWILANFDISKYLARSDGMTIEKITL